MTVLITEALEQRVEAPGKTAVDQDPMPQPEASLLSYRASIRLSNRTLARLAELLADQKPYYSGKHRRHGLNVQVLADPIGRLVRASPALPGAVHDLTAARTAPPRSCRRSSPWTPSKPLATQDDEGSE